MYNKSLDTASIKSMRKALAEVEINEADRAKHYKSATPPEDMKNNRKGKGAQDMMQPADNAIANPAADEVDVVNKDFTDMTKNVKVAKKRRNDKDVGDKDIVEPDTSANKDTPNLKNLLTEKKESEAEKKDKEESNEKIPFTEDEYKILINDFSESLKEKKSEVAILKKRNSIEGTEITFHLDNELEGTIFDSIINRLKEKLKNRFEEKIVLKKEINETEKEKTIYTNKDKFEYLSKKNTNLSDLKNKLGLDYEF